MDLLTLIKKILKKIDFHRWHRFLGTLSDSLYDICLSTKLAKKFWNALEAKYGMDDASLDLFIISKICKYAMVDSKYIRVQIHEFQFFLRNAELTSYNFF